MNDGCIICDGEYIISDPSTYEYRNGKVICKNCWLEIYDNLSWGSKREERIIFEYKKVPITHKLKWSIWKRDNFSCKVCGKKENLTIDHINPESSGGEITEDNLQTLCKSCNSQKGQKYNGE